MSESRPLISECPSCRTRFRVSVEQLAVAGGRVRCGACLAVFDGREAEVEDESTATVGDDPVDALLESARTTEASATGSAEEHAPSPITANDLETATGPIPDRPMRPFMFATLIMAALALLVAGVGVLQYDIYVRDPVLRNVYESIGVDVPRYRALGAIEVANPSVDERLGAPEPLIVRLDLTNTAPRHQRFPTLAVRFHRDDGAPLAAEHRVEPAEYLPSRQSRRMSPNRTTSVSLRLDDPGPEASGYSISLL